MDLPVGEVDGIPAQRHQFDWTQAVPVGEQHHGRVAMPIAVTSRRLHQLLHLGVGEVFARAGVGIWPSAGRPMALNCPINGG
jgi:hypothetical protein